MKHFESFKIFRGYYLFILLIVCAMALWIYQESRTDDSYFTRLDSIVEVYGNQRFRPKNEKENSLQNPEESNGFNDYPRVAMLGPDISQR
ncbi:MAG: hypothetical protein JW928_05860 [Candidatus Aureabacteria bacterium]|nr:hypothetical protein [Candidatus Auribacterota bacterium]